MLFTPSSTPHPTARVLLVGAGGLGSPVALALARWASASRTPRLVLTLADDDQVDLSNLHRQLLHKEAALGQAKVLSAAATLAGAAPGLTLRARAARLTPESAAELCAGQDLLIDGSDSIATKFLVSDSAARLGVPAVIGGVVRFAGQVMTVRPGGACYRCLFEEPPPEGSTATCQAVGVLGPACGIIGALQAQEALRILTGAAPRYADAVLVVDLLRARYRRVPVPRRVTCPACATPTAARGLC